MEASITVRWAILPLLITASAFFAGCEVAFFSLSRLQVDRLRHNGGWAGQRVAELLSKPERLLITLYTCNELVNVAISVVVTYLAIETFDGVWVGVALGAGAFLLITFGEITPKTFALYTNEKWALIAAPFLAVLTVAIYPAQYVVTSAANWISRLLGGKSQADNFALTEDEIKTLVEEGADKGVIDESESEMIQNVFDLGDLTVGDLMTPRTEILALDVNMPLKEAWDRMAQSSFARAPVYNGTIDNIEGVLFKKDLLKYDYPPPPSLALRDLLREPYIAPVTVTVNELLRGFKKRKRHMAVAMDEYGGVQGIITMDDIIAELIGQTGAPGSADGELVKPAADGAYIVSAAMSLDAFNGRFGLGLSHDELETVGGYVFHLFGRASQLGESVEAEGFRFTVEKLKGRRIMEILVSRVPIEASSESPAGGEGS
jgi:CBS domain containing-hemolysin-like protein